MPTRAEKIYPNYKPAFQEMKKEKNFPIAYNGNNGDLEVSHVTEDWLRIYFNVNDPSSALEETNVKVDGFLTYSFKDKELEEKVESTLRSLDKPRWF